MIDKTLSLAQLLMTNFRLPNPNPETYEVYGSNPIQLDCNIHYWNVAETLILKLNLRITLTLEGLNATFNAS